MGKILDVYFLLNDSEIRDNMKVTNQEYLYWSSCNNKELSGLFLSLEVFQVAAVITLTLSLILSFFLSLLGWSGLSWGIWVLLLWPTGSLVTAHRLSSSAACGFLVPWPGIEPAFPALQGGFFNHQITSEVYSDFFFKWVDNNTHKYHPTFARPSEFSACSHIQLLVWPLKQLHT